MQFWPHDDEYICSKHVEAWNKLIVKQKFCASSWLITEVNILRCTVSKRSKFDKYIACLSTAMFYIFIYSWHFILIKSTVRVAQYDLQLICVSYFTWTYLWTSGIAARFKLISLTLAQLNLYVLQAQVIRVPQHQGSHFVWFNDGESERDTNKQLKCFRYIWCTLKSHCDTLKLSNIGCFIILKDINAFGNESHFWEVLNTITFLTFGSLETESVSFHLLRK